MTEQVEQVTEEISIADRFAQAFKTELEWIKNPQVADFVRQVVEAFCPKEFFIRPASKSGRYHPKISAGDGGLVRHTRYAAWWGLRLARAMLGSGDNKAPVPYQDEIVAALLLHDIMKDGDPQKVNLGRPGDYLTKCHGVDLCEAVSSRLLQGKITEEFQTLILYGVAAHMGIWTEPQQYQPDNIKGVLARKIAQIVHLADYCAAQKADEILLGLNSPA